MKEAVQMQIFLDLLAALFMKFIMGKMLKHKLTRKRANFVT